MKPLDDSIENTYRFNPPAAFLQWLEDAQNLNDMELSPWGWTVQEYELLFDRIEELGGDVSTARQNLATFFPTDKYRRFRFVTPFAGGGKVK